MLGETPTADQVTLSATRAVRTFLRAYGKKDGARPAQREKSTVEA
jgi:hypothetical protein